MKIFSKIKSLTNSKNQKKAEQPKNSAKTHRAALEKIFSQPQEITNVVNTNTSKMRYDNHSTLLEENYKAIHQMLFSFKINGEKTPEMLKARCRAHVQLCAKAKNEQQLLKIFNMATSAKDKKTALTIQDLKTFIEKIEDEDDKKYVMQYYDVWIKTQNPTS